MAFRMFILQFEAVQKLCEENRIPGVARFSRMWLIPKDAEKPVDGRLKISKFTDM
jgi:4-alpha-glucanotransferase